ncbi:MAG: hypothetical protein ABL904_20515, partial [Hyphomicrobiaceae bacterium]
PLSALRRRIAMWKSYLRIAFAGVAGVAALTAQTLSSGAADIYDRYGSRSSSSAYEDPRYADIYTIPAPPPRYAAPAPRYERPYAYDDDAPPPRDRHGYLRPIDPPRYRSAQPACLPHQEIRRTLMDDGWRDFRDLEFRGDIAVVHARRPNGQPYALKIDRCSGDIVRARPLGDRPVPYAYRERYGERTY